MRRVGQHSRVLAVIEASEEAVIREFHSAEGYRTAEDDQTRQKPTLTPAEVQTEITDALVAGIMAGGPV